MNDPELTDKAEENNEQTSQEDLEERYLEQQRRLRCEGCGEAGEVF